MTVAGWTELSRPTAAGKQDDSRVDSRLPTRWEAPLPPAAAADAAEPEQPVLVEYVSGGRVAVVTLNRPHADNAITTELAASLIEILETIAARPPCGSPS